MYQKKICKTNFIFLRSPYKVSNVIAWEHTIYGLLNIVAPDYHVFDSISGLILGLHPANERRRYKVTPSLIGWAQT